MLHAPPLDDRTLDTAQALLGPGISNINANTTAALVPRVAIDHPGHPAGPAHNQAASPTQAAVSNEARMPEEKPARQWA